MNKTASLTLRIPPDLKEAIVKAAKDADQSVAEYVLRAVKLRMRGAAEVTHVFKLEGSDPCRR